jgi:hypothetical protein
LTVPATDAPDWALITGAEIVSMTNQGSQGLVMVSRFQIEWKPGNGQDHFIRCLGGPLVQEPLGITEGTGYGGFRNGPATEFIGNQNDVAQASRGCDPLEFGAHGIFYFAGRAIAMFPEQVAKPNRQAIDQNRIRLTRGTLHGAGQPERFFDRLPAAWPVRAVPLDARRHLRIVTGWGRGHIRDATGRRRQALGQSGFAASSAAKNQC